MENRRNFKVANIRPLAIGPVTSCEAERFSYARHISVKQPNSKFGRVDPTTNSAQASSLAETLRSRKRQSCSRRIPVAAVAFELTKYGGWPSRQLGVLEKNRF
jgi:hypothetical protein